MPRAVNTAAVADLVGNGAATVAVARWIGEREADAPESVPDEEEPDAGFGRARRTA